MQLPKWYHWYHEVSEDWLKARKNFLTATDIVGLIPEYKRYKKNGKAGIPPAFAALWEKKHSDIAVDPRSYKDAARGHILEPYAVYTYNE